MTIIKAIITTMDNLETLKEQIFVLKDEPLSEIIVVNNGSIDNTKDWLDEQKGLTVIHRENKGAGPGRNNGLNVAGEYDYVLMLDGGIRPLRQGVQRMLDYFHTPVTKYRPDVIGVEIPDFRTDKEVAWRRWPNPILDEHTYINTRLSHTAYCLAKYKAFDGIRFSEEGPFGEPGWGADDDEMAYRWQEKDIIVHVVSCACNLGKECTGVHPYRHASGSFLRLFKETGIWPNQFGSVYEKRLVSLYHNWPQYEPVGQWGEPWLTVVVKVSDIESTARIIKKAHDELRKRRFEKPFNSYWNPYHIHVWGNNEEWLTWAKLRELRQHQGTAIIDNDGKIISRNEENESTWTGDFILNISNDWKKHIRENSFYYALVSNELELNEVLKKYNEIHPCQPVKNNPSDKREL